MSSQPDVDGVLDVAVRFNLEPGFLERGPSFGLCTSHGMESPGGGQSCDGHGIGEHDSIAGLGGESAVVER